ncbi:hypothetical protein [Gloeothece verrucosa]|uniref:Uncharacterized protein n=1 Tax=Gloeothece verrucosa (strain PCC 7822) TaxID=497965 RepID=E0UHR4_GLOV7|nr:hypothetical protein [Gloeothece verrucosa]ADN13321.1 hypothetical protein Cyan7822_1320 [Gloeothece verrucosa PCC 7822]
MEARERLGTNEVSNKANEETHKLPYECHHWTDIQSQAYAVNLEPSMLTGECVKYLKLKLKGEPRDGGFIPIRPIKFDKEYIIEFLRVKVIEPFKGLFKNFNKELESCMTEAYRRASAETIGILENGEFENSWLYNLENHKAIATQTVVEVSFEKKIVYVTIVFPFLPVNGRKLNFWYPCVVPLEKKECDEALMTMEWDLEIEGFISGLLLLL